MMLFDGSGNVLAQLNSTNIIQTTTTYDCYGSSKQKLINTRSLENSSIFRKKFSTCTDKIAATNSIV